MTLEFFQNAVSHAAMYTAAEYYLTVQHVMIEPDNSIEAEAAGKKL